MTQNNNELINDTKKITASQSLTKKSDTNMKKNGIRLNKPRKSKLKAKRLRARMTSVSKNGQSYSDHLRKTRSHNHNFKKMTQKIKQMSRNDSCPALKPLSIQEKESIENTVSLVLFSRNFPLKILIFLIIIIINK